MAMPRKLTPERQRDLADKYAGGASLEALKEKFGVSYSTIRTTVLNCGGTLRKVGRPRKDS